MVIKKSFAENDAQSCLGLYENRLFKRDPLILTGTLPFPLRAAAQTRIAWGWRTRLPQPPSPCTAALQNTRLYTTEVLLTCSERPRGAQQQGRCSAGATFSICQRRNRPIDHTRNRPDRPRPDHYWHPHPADTSALAALQLCNIFVTANRSRKFKSHQLSRQQRAGRREV